VKIAPKTESRRRWRVVIFDDDVGFAHLLKLVLSTDERLELVGEARNGREGIELVDRLRPDIVVTDMQMPIMDGRAVVSELRKRHPGLPVVVVTGSDRAKEGPQTVRAGAAAYVIKSRIARELIDTITAVLA
jgi:NarL family two-component system response regulator LiaR